MDNFINLPEFIIAGGQRCGTTWLFNHLEAHPGVFLPSEKECHFFSSRYEKGWDYYQSFFSSANSTQLVGEATPDYLHSIEAPKRIASFNPDIKLVFVLRNPIDRANSSYWFFQEFNEGHSFEQALEIFPGLISRGEYSTHLQRWLAYFPRNQIKIFLFDELKQNDKGVLSEICDFIGVSSSDLGDIESGQIINPSIFPRTQSMLHKFNLDGLVSIIKKTPLNQIIRKQYSSGKLGGYPAVCAETRNRLIDHYKPFNGELEVLLDRSLAHWQ